MSKVYFADMEVQYGEDLLKKFKKLVLNAGLDNIDFKDKLVAVKLHMGEWGNMVFPRQQYAFILCNLIKERGGKPFITDANTLYPGFRGNAVDHLTCASWNGYNMLSCGVPIIIADGLRGTDEIEIPLENAVYCKKPKIGSAIAEADVIISIAHAKGHESAGFGGTIKNIGMGSGSKKGKMEMHSHATPVINTSACIGCGNCVRHCANNGVSVVDKKAVINEKTCLGCGYCMAYCAQGAINCKWDEANSVLNCKIAEYAAAVLKNKSAFFVNIATDIQYNCDCNGEHHQDLVPDVGFFASTDPVAIDKATIDAINAMPITPHSPADYKHENTDKHDVFALAHPDTNWESSITHAELLKLGSQSYELVTVK